MLTRKRRDPIHARARTTRRVHNAPRLVHAGDIEHHQRHCLRRSRETFQDHEGLHFMQITKRKFLPIAPDIVTVVAQVAAKRFHATPSSTSSMTRFWRPWPRTSR